MTKNAMTEDAIIEQAEICRQILAYITDTLVAEDVTVEADDDLLSGEILDSLAVLRLATFVDETWSLGMKPTDFRIENFMNASVLSAYVVRCLDAPVGED